MALSDLSTKERVSDQEAVPVVRQPVRYCLRYIYSGRPYTFGAHTRGQIFQCNQRQTARPPTFVRCRTKERLDDLDYGDATREPRPQRRESVDLALEGQVAHGCACTPQCPSESTAQRLAEERLRAA